MQMPGNSLFLCPLWKAALECYPSILQEEKDLKSKYCCRKFSPVGQEIAHLQLFLVHTIIDFTIFLGLSVLYMPMNKLLPPIEPFLSCSFVKTKYKNVVNLFCR